MTPVGSRTPPIAYHQTAQRCCQRKHERTGEPMDTPVEAGYAASWTTEGTSGEKIVTEAEWAACTGLRSMLELFGGCLRPLVG